jgi:hypothetical protein
VRIHRGADRPHEPVTPHLQEWNALRLAVVDEVERDVKPAGFLDQPTDVPVDGVRIQGIHFGHTHLSTVRGDLVGHQPLRRRTAAGEEQPSALPSERASHRPADGAAAAVDHGHFVVEQHVPSFPAIEHPGAPISGVA